MNTTAKRLITEKPSATIYNHDIMNCTTDNVAGNYLNSGRALGLTDTGDIIQPNPDLKAQWPYITEHYFRAGLSHCDDVIWDVSCQLFRQHTSYSPPNAGINKFLIFYSCSIIAEHMDDTYAIYIQKFN